MEQASLFGAPGALDMRAPARRQSAASRRAAERLQASGRLSARMATILRAFRTADPQTLISSELAATTRILRQSLTAPIARARAHGWLQPVGLRPGPYGAEQTSFRITAAGLQALRAFEQAPPPTPRRRPR